MLVVRNCWYVALWSNELVGDELVSRTILNEPILLYRAADGSVVAMEDRCCHRLAPLSLGERDGDNIRCMYHGFKFDPTGCCIEVPGQETIPRGARVRSFPVFEDGSWVWVWMGDPDKADRAFVPSGMGPGSPGLVMRQGQLDYDCDYQLINDNLTDFSHLAYVHRNSFGATEDFSRSRPKVVKLDRGVNISRWQIGNQTKVLETAAPEERWSEYEYLVPGVLLMRVASYPSGTAQTCNFERPSEDVPFNFEFFSSQAVTPISDQQTRYFFCIGPRSGPGADEIAEQLMQVTLTAFAEDKAMIEAQQRIINADPARKELLFGHDNGPVQMRRVIEGLAAAEQ